MSVTTFSQSLLDAVRPWGLALDEQQVALLWNHFERMIETNRVMNLTRITEPDAAATQLYADSLSLVAWADANGVDVRTVVDIGTGAGFPAVPLAVARPDWDVTAIDGTGKKIRFVEETAAALGLAHLHALHVRAELWRSPVRADLVVAKAVGPLDRCLEYGRRLTRPGGYIIVFKSPNVPIEEVAEAAGVAKRTGLRRRPLFEYELPDANGSVHRVLWVYQAQAP